MVSRLSFDRSISMIALMFAAIGVARTGGAELPQFLRDAFQANVKQLDPLSVKWEYSYFDGNTLQQKTQERFTWSDGRFYLATSTVQPPNFGQTENSFDGQIFYAGGPGKATLVKELARTAATRRLLVLEYFDDACLLIPTTPAEMAGDQPLHRILQSLASGAELGGIDAVQDHGRDLLCIRLTVANEYRQRALRENLAEAERIARKWAKREQDVQCVLLTYRKMREMPDRLVDTYYLDPSLHYAVARWERAYPDGTLLYRCDNADFEQLQGRQLYLPTSCTVREFWNTHPPIGFKLSSAPLYTRSVHVIAISPQRDPDVTFALNYIKPGTYILDASQPHATRKYQIPTALEELVMGPRFSLVRSVLIAINLCMGGWIIVYVLRKRRKNMKPTE